MAGLIRIDEERSWSAAGWVFDHVLSLTRCNLPKQGSSKIVRLMDEAAAGLNDIPLEQLSVEELSIFRSALEAAYLQAKRAGSESFSDPEFYPGFMQRFGELLALVRKSERSAII